VKRKYKILLAEDFEPSRNIMSEILSALGYEYETVANGYDVIFALKDKKFDLILLDLKCRCSTDLKLLNISDEI
jgi:CheY-like chemotaxis protein